MCEIGNVLLALVLGAVAYRDWRTKQISCLSNYQDMLIGKMPTKLVQRSYR